jgi:hypothetical protein
MLLAVEQPQDELLAERRRKDGDTEVDRLLAEPNRDPPVLR